MNRSTFSSRSKSKSKDRCGGSNESAAAFRSRSRSRSLNQSTISSGSRSRNKIDDAMCVHGLSEETNSNHRQNQESKSGATRSVSRGRIGERSGSMLLMPCMRAANNNSGNQATASDSNSNNDGDRCRSGRRNR